ncbi:phospholipase D-like domain-containing protein [Candidatus Palibaumannia cicadellinicola]|uniref:Putative phospholipase n=1 Tax=Candidatus Palibaumannia cicadellinicola TaxID=186490 RepID=A0A0K2BLB2_9GAMM|nr:phospholipase D-like domain-containing protein [Candidatus Baumannia cicadellinicola]AKZ66176.1 putative phospholipase [Candidatus Baumannia cicadellinicola]
MRTVNKNKNLFQQIFFKLILIIFAFFLFLITYTIICKINNFYVNNLHNTNIIVLFSPNNQTKKEILKLINNSKKSIDIAAYSFTDIDIAKALKKAKFNKIKIRILLDKKQILKIKNQI